MVNEASTYASAFGDLNVNWTKFLSVSLNYCCVYFRFIVCNNTHFLSRWLSDFLYAVGTPWHCLTCGVWYTWSYETFPDIILPPTPPPIPVQPFQTVLTWVYKTIRYTFPPPPWYLKWVKRKEENCLCCPVCCSPVDREFVLVICKGWRFENRVSRIARCMWLV